MYYVKITTALFLLLCIKTAHAQDTVRYGKSYHYSSKKYPVRGKEFVFRLKYGREDIVFNEAHRRVEYCYYYDEKRECFGKTYKLINDSTLQVGDTTRGEHLEVWVFKRLPGGQYLVRSCDDDICESGSASELIPLRKQWTFITIDNQWRDTLWIVDYTQYKPENPYSQPEYLYKERTFNDKVYEAAEVHEMPRLADGAFLPDTIRLANKWYCFSSPMYMIKSISFVVTSDGRVENIKQEFGNLDEGCSYYMQELRKVIARFGHLKPAKVDGKNVPMRYVIGIDMMDGH